MKYALLSTRAIVLVSALFVVGCDDATDTTAQVTTPSQEHVTAAVTPRQMELWTRSCALCHVDGTGGAPRMGNSDEWADRKDQGMEVMLSNTLDGIGNMPPLGYCMACEKEDFRALIGMMAGGAQ